jgi:hypothetical protein
MMVGMLGIAALANTRVPSSVGIKGAFSILEIMSRKSKPYYSAADM